jgi:hypothetical protein
MRISRLKIPTIVLAVVALVVGVGGGAMGAKLITGDDIKNNTVTSSDIKDGTLVTKDLKSGGVAGNRLQGNSTPGNKLQKGSVTGDRLKDAGVTSAKIKDGTIGANDLSDAAKASLTPTFAGPNWGVVDRNVIANGDSYLRAGPTDPISGPPPMGIGSLGIRTGTGEDKSAFGDQTDFVGMDLTTVTALAYSVFTTGENVTSGGGGAAGLGNLPNLQFEIDPNLTGVQSNFSTFNFIPDAAVPGQWTELNAIASGHWVLGGAAGVATNCQLGGDICTWTEALARLDDGDQEPPKILTMSFSKGRDFAFSGAVDALVINDQTFDFEPTGVIESSTPAAKLRELRKAG